MLQYIRILSRSIQCVTRMVSMKQGQLVPDKGECYPDTLLAIDEPQFHGIIDGNGPFPPEVGRYRLYASLGDPFSQRVLLARSLNGLKEAVSVTILNPYLDRENGWVFSGPGDFPGCSGDLNGFKYLHQVYSLSDPEYSGPVSLPLLWCDKTKKIVNNSSLQIMRMLGTSFGVVAESDRKILAPSDKLEKIKQMNALINESINMGVYRAGYALKQEVYEAEVKNVFATLECMEETLSATRFLNGSSITEPDLLLFTTLVRFDPICSLHLKCNLKSFQNDFTNLFNYCKDLYQTPGFSETVNFRHTQAYHFVNHEEVNPKKVIPKGGFPNLLGKHDRASFSEEMEVSGVKKAKIAGEFVRGVSGFRNWITADGSSGFKAEAGRYHLIIANNCPWCHRVRLTWCLKGLQNVVSLAELHYRREDTNSWWQMPPGTTDPVTGITYPKELYERFGSAEKSVPLLYDTETQTIVNNESSEIIRMFDQAFVGMASNNHALYPPELAAEIDDYDSWIYPEVANGAYRAGFANSQVAYEMAFDVFFNALDRLEVIFAKRKYLCGDRMTEADVKLFPPLFRFDHAYFIRFNLNKKTIRDGYPNIHRFLLDMWRNEGVREGSNMDHVKKGYFGRTATGLVPIGPSWTFDQEIGI